MNKLLHIKAQTDSLTLLYVEDEPEIRQQLSALFGKLFGTVHMASDGAEGLAQFLDHRDAIDLIITDIKMPKINGLEMARRIRADKPSSHIILLTAHNEPEFFLQAIEIGVDGFIIKPVQTTQLLDTLVKSTHAIHLEREVKEYREGLEEKLQEKTQALEKIYTHDPITGCYNREKLQQDLRKHGHLSLLLLNIDNFNAVNSTYGYRIGDRALRAFADFLRARTKKTSTLYHLAGDEFIVLWQGEKIEKKQAEAFSENINQALSKHIFLVDDCEIRLTCTIGIANGFPEREAEQDVHNNAESENNESANNGSHNNHPWEDSLVKAHAAMEEIRQTGKNRYLVYRPNSPYVARQKNNIAWMRKVREALEHDAIAPYFQPIVDNATLQPVKYECLARIEDGDKIIGPHHFIEPARLVGLLPKITEVMATKAYTYFADKSQGFTLNITEDDLKAGFLPNLLAQLGKTHHVPAARVTLEILENISAHGSEEVLAQLLQLKSMGFQVALDDFGSDKSNFYRLQKMNVDIIKIDGSFIKDITTNTNSQIIARTIVEMAKAMECQVVAEFVHSQEVLAKVKQLGIPYSQGYLFGTPQRAVLS